MLCCGGVVIYTHMLMFVLKEYHCETLLCLVEAAHKKKKIMND